MTTALSQQLAAIAQNSTQQLDLKAQKHRHSKSLLFPHWEASRQSFDHLYHLCVGEGGFEDLCTLDARFRQYGSNLFAGDSVNLERESLTKAENERVDDLVRSFLQLVQARLQLLPALRAVEWIVRRWRVHEHAPLDLLLAFLPYHGSDVFATALSLVSNKTLPADLGFLRPYIGTGHLVPRHAIVAAVSKTPSLLTTLSRWIMDAAGRGYAGANVIGFWTGVGAQGLAAQLDVANSSRISVRQERTEQVLVRILPFIEDALQISKSKQNDELYCGALLLVTILGTKAQLSTAAVRALMAAVANSWSENTQEEALSCLAILASGLDGGATVPIAVARTLCESGQTARTMRGLQEKGQNLASLAFALTSALVKHTSKKDDRQASTMAFIKEVFTENILTPQSQQIISHALTEKGLVASDVPLLTSLESELAHSEQSQEVHQAVDEGDAMDLDELPVAAKELNETDVQQLITRLQHLSAEVISFLDPALDLAYFTSYAVAFNEVAQSETALAAFLDMSAFQKDQSTEGPLRLISFLTRVSCSAAFTAQARANALSCLANLILDYSAQQHKETLDFQTLLPYLVVYLSDASQEVRQHAARLAGILLSCYRVGSASKGKVPSNAIVMGKYALHGNKEQQAPQLSSQDAFTFFNSALIPIMEDCVLDSAFVIRHLQAVLNGDDSQRPLKTALRSCVCSFLALQAALTPSLKAKAQSLEVLRGVGKAASDARKNILAPQLRLWVSKSGDTLIGQDQASQSQLRHVDDVFIRSISHRSAEEVGLLKQVAVREIGARDHLSTLAFGHLGRLFKSMKEGTQTALLDFLMSLVIDETKEELVRAEALETIRGVPLSADLLVHLLEQALSSTQSLETESQPSAKRRRTSSGHSSGESYRNTAALKTVTVFMAHVLELTESSKEGKDIRLIRPLFQLVSEVRKLMDVSGSELTYNTHLLLTTINAVISSILSSTNVAANGAVDENNLRPDLVVDLIRNTSSPVIHTSALQLMSSLASWKPDIVLHSVMPLFTFATNSVMIRSDELSGSVGEDAVETIIGALASSLRKKKAVSVLEGASELLLSFVAAWEHIPLHRREPLFSKLAETLGTNDVLGGLIAALMGRYHATAHHSSKVVQFTVEILSRFDLGTQVAALCQYLGLISDLVSGTETNLPKRVSAALLGLDDNATADQLYHKTTTTLEGLTKVLNVHTDLESRLNKAFKKNNESTAGARKSFSDLMEQALALSTSRMQGSKANITDQAESLVVALTAPLPTQYFLEVAEQLSAKGTSAMHQALIAMLGQRAGAAKPHNANAAVFMNQGLGFCSKWLAVNAQQSTDVETRRAAVSIIDTISEKFGKADLERTTEAARVVAGSQALASADTNLRLLSMLTLATLVEVLGEASMPILPEVTSIVLGYLEDNSKSDVGDDLRVGVCRAAIAFMSATLDNLPWLTGQRTVEKAMTLAVQMSSEIDNAGDFFSLVAKRVDPAVCFGALNNVLTECKNVEAFTTVMETFIVAVKHHPKKVITTNAQRVLPILLSAFDAPRLSLLRREEAPAETSDLANQAAMDVVLKLNDTTFRPFFIRLVEWAKESNVDLVVVREQSVYSFATVLSEQLRSLVTGYASYLVESISQELEGLRGSLSTKDATQTKPQEAKLLSLLLQYLTSSFTHDADNWWANPSHFSAISSPLLALIGTAKPLSVAADSNNDLIDRIVSTTIAFASASSMEQVREISQVLLTHIRSGDAAIRLAAVRIQAGITERYEEDWLELLPESLPAISELLEDDDEKVERETLKWVKIIEEVTGESVSGMLG
ncbi:hypothetical protein K431DRAFT_214057 [Polychaeton citri CBS 116435]|uniref:U3 small nucleolar RNA-associated protein 10 n=1 Tax=Polychaeton citri CBS 116435 TaxID=1314669 RepID=A0A9P4US10_9PEZI|nr:hypothetical protein K431DRAFT_214057 [Polychaeton citri CBS 116435]